MPSRCALVQAQRDAEDHMDKVLLVKGGSVVGLYSDELRALGTLASVERASHVEFDAERGGWTVELEPGVIECAPWSTLTGAMLARDDENGLYPTLMKSNALVFETREAALAAEVKFIQSRMLTVGA